MRKDIIIIILSIGLFIISLLLFNTCRGGEQKPIEKIDTVYQVKYDTITVNRIINNNIYHYDTIMINDTVYIKDIPQTYKDSNENYSISINAVKLYDYDLSVIAPNKRYKFVFEDPALTEKYNGVYLISSVESTFINEGKDLALQSIALFKKVVV